LSTAEELIERRFRGRTDLISLFIRVADRCNHTCEHCFEVQGHRGELDTASVIAIIDRAVENGLLFLTLSGGEITLRSDLLEILEHAHARHLAVTLKTNAYLVTEELASRLAELAVWRVQVSLYAADPEIHDAITKVPGSHARTVNGVKLLRRNGISVSLSYTQMSRNVHELEPMRALAAGLGVNLARSDQLAPMENGESLRDLRAPADALLEQAKAFSFDFSADAQRRARGGGTCRVGQGHLSVDPNGEVFPCSMLAVSLGNAVNQPLAEIAASETARFIQSLNSESLHGCRDCALLPGCTRCHANALREGGDALGPYLSACEIAVARFRSSRAGNVTILTAPDEPTRPTSLGPFKIEEPTTLRQIPDRRNAADEQSTQRFDWIRPAYGHDARRLKAAGEALVPLRIKPRASGGG
jgi:radical SAM protein with 4Fe4S-binding SPASM domain